MSVPVPSPTFLLHRLIYASNTSANLPRIGFYIGKLHFDEVYEIKYYLKENGRDTFER
jgi:hypothetical protein